MRVLSKTEPIIPGQSIGGICVGDDAEEIVGQLEQMGATVTCMAFENVGQHYFEWQVKDWGISFVESSSGKIERIACTLGYEGRYKQIFYPGMSVGQVIRASKKQVFIHGMIVVDGEFGAFFDVPEIYDGKQYDDIDTVLQLPDDMILDSLHVMTGNWWC
jgi:hypothetical protein